jgi:hypothetical protein
MSEMALAHTVSDKVEAAYRRGDMREKRRRLMADWAAYCASPPTAKKGNVVPRLPNHGRAHPGTGKGLLLKQRTRVSVDPLAHCPRFLKNQAGEGNVR